MVRVVTLRERRARALEERHHAQRALEVRLGQDAARHGGVYRLFGSSARGDLRPESDVDILADFPAGTVDAAVRDAEAACARMGLRHDVLDQSACFADFLRDVLPESRSVG